MDHMKNVWIKTEETDEAQSYASSVKIKEELQEDTDEEYAEEPLRIKRSTGHTKEEPDLNFNTDDSEDMYIEDRLGMDWASIHMKEESRRKFSTDDAMRKGEYSADSVDEDGSTSPKRQPDSAKIPMTDRYSHLLNHPYSQKYIDRRQLFVGNLTWWTTDQDIADAILGIGVTDFKEVKFFENRLNGQSKGFCVVTMGSEESLRICMEKLPDKELHGQRLLVSFPTRSAISVFEAQTKKGLEPRQNPGPKRLIGNKARPPLGMRSVRLPPGMLPPGSAQQMPGALMGPAGHQPLWHPHVPPPPPPQGHAHSGFQYNNWNTPRANAPAAPPPPPLYSAPPPPPGPPPGPPPAHTAPVFFQQGTGPPHHPPPPTHQPPPNFYAPPPAPQTQFSVPPPKLHPDGPPPVSEVEFQEVMGRNRSISSSAIARAVSDAAAGEYTRAIETLVTAISLIKQSKVANDARCKILVSSLQDTLNGIETKSFESARRERSQSRERERSLRARRERSRSHDRAYRERSRERERERDHDRSYADVYLHDRSRSRERERERDYRDRAHEDRYYDERYREREQERDHEGIRHEAERERERDRDRERRDDGRESSHRSIRH